MTPLSVKSPEIESMIQQTYEQTFAMAHELKDYDFIKNEYSAITKSKFNAAFLNGVLYFDDETPEFESKIKSLHQKVSENGRPYLWRFHPAQEKVYEIEQILLSLGLVESEAHTSVYSHIDHSIFNKFDFNNKIEFVPVNHDNFNDWYLVFSDAFEIPNEISSFFMDYEKINAQKSEKNYHSYIGYFQSKPVAVVSTVITDSPLGALFNIASLKSERGKSFGMQAALYGVKKLLDANKTMVGQFGSKLGVQSYTKLGAKLGNEHKVYIWQP